ncbi:MAG: hypothetical protein K0U10_02245 [Gammaproteobacteria bacterium]|nr:hypothetical protein [Gammaproteobacteria bacterium]
MFIIGTPIEKLPVFLKGLKAEILARLQSPEDLATLLISLEGEKLQLTFKVFKDKIQSPHDFGLMIGYLSPAQRGSIVACLETDDLSKIIDVARDFSLIMAYALPEQRKNIFDAIKKDLPGLIKSAHDFKLVMEHLSEDPRLEVIATLTRDNLVDFIKPRHEFKPPLNPFFYIGYLLNLPLNLVVICVSAVISLLYPEPQDSSSAECIQFIELFNDVMQYLSSKQRQEMIEDTKEDLVRLISATQSQNTAALNFHSTMEKLLPDERQESINAFTRADLLGFIQSTEDFGYLIKYMLADQVQGIVADVKEKLVGFIQSADSLKHVLEYVPVEQRNKFITEHVLPHQVFIMSDLSLDECLTFAAPIDEYLAVPPQEPHLALEEPLLSLTGRDNKRLIKASPI